MTAAAAPTPTTSVLDSIGNTPMHEVTNIETGKCRLFLKLESQNPGGSIKDRIGLSMIRAAEESGALKPGGTLVEATAGNTGLGLALVAAQRGYQMVIIVPDKMAQEKVFHLKALGTKVITTRSDVGKGHPEYYQDMAERLAAENGWYYVNQFENAANPRAHYETTGPEIAAQVHASGAGNVDAMICGVGSGGTITGLSHYFADTNEGTEMVLADPEGSILTHYINTGDVSDDVGSWLVEGIGEDFLPPIADFSHCKTAYTVSDADAFRAGRDLLKAEGILAGSSSGTLIEAALRYCRSQTEPKNVVTFVCDRGDKYLSKMYNDHWMADNGFIRPEPTGDLRDLIARKHDENQVITLKPDTTLAAAYRQMKLYEISQLPVMTDTGALVGLLDEEDLLMSVYQADGSFDGQVADIMTTQLHTVGPDAKPDDIMPLLSQGMVVPVVEGDRFHGIITKIDMLNHMRLNGGL